jgi:hypothetical protein
LAQGREDRGLDAAADGTLERQCIQRALSQDHLVAEFIGTLGGSRTLLGMVRQEVGPDLIDLALQHQDCTLIVGLFLEVSRQYYLLCLELLEGGNPVGTRAGFFPHENLPHVGEAAKRVVKLLLRRDGGKGQKIGGLLVNLTLKGGQLALQGGKIPGQNILFPCLISGAVRPAR